MGRLTQEEKNNFFNQFYGKTLTQMQAVPKMTPERLGFFIQNKSDVLELIKNGFSIEDIAGLRIGKLINLCQSSSRVHDMLQFVTVEQILGLNHTPPAVNKVLYVQQELDTRKQWSYLQFDFKQRLELKGWTLDVVLGLNGMTQSKLVQLYQHSDVLFKLLDRNLSLKEVAQMDENRLSAILSNYSTVTLALKFVSIQDVAGLDPLPKEPKSLGFFASIAKLFEISNQLDDNPIHQSKL